MVREVLNLNASFVCLFLEPEECFSGDVSYEFGT